MPMISRRNFARLPLIGLGLGLGLANCASQSRVSSPTPSVAAEDVDLTIWWEQGYLPEENTGIVQLVRQWEAATGRKADLKLMHISGLQQELLKAIIGNTGEYIHCWLNLLESIGLTQQDIPQDWQGFWQFWEQAQQSLRKQGHTDLYGIGLCMSASGVDTFTSLRWFLDAYNATVVSNDGELVLPSPENRQKFVAALKEYTSFYQQGFVPPDALDWTASGNNSRFLEGGILMTHNPTLSIPLTQKLEPNRYNQDASDRYRQIVTLGWPHKVDGTPMQPRKGIKQVISPKAGRHPEAAQEFLTYLIQPAVLNQLLKEGFKGRFLPVMPQRLTDAYWQNAADPHLSTALNIQEQPSPVPYEILHPVYSQILGQQVWGNTILKIVKDKASVEQAADWAIAEIETIWTEWEQAA